MFTRPTRVMDFSPLVCHSTLTQSPPLTTMFEARLAQVGAAAAAPLPLLRPIRSICKAHLAAHHCKNWSWPRVLANLVWRVRQLAAH
jgi:hypothetical protein